MSMSNHFKDVKSNWLTNNYKFVNKQKRKISPELKKIIENFFSPKLKFDNKF